MAKSSGRHSKLVFSLNAAGFKNPAVFLPKTLTKQAFLYLDFFVKKCYHLLR